MELLRVVAMFLVLIVHADFAALGFPSHTEAIDETWPTLARYLFEGLALVCVDTFVMLSGWFGIRPTKKGLFKFLFEVFFFAFICYVFRVLMGISDSAIATAPSYWEQMRNIVLFTSPLYWFVISYLGLFILSPVLNTFVEKIDQKQYRIVLIGYFVFQTIYGWLVSCNPQAGQFSGGYSIISFIGLYLLARYLRLYPCKATTMKRNWDLVVYIGLCIINASIGFCAAYFDIDGVNARIVGYTNPLVIAASMYLLLYFSKLHFSSKFVNWLGAGAFGVFLLHLNENIYFPYFKPWMQEIWQNLSGICCFGAIAALLIFFFIIGELLDHLRAYFWTPIEKKKFAPKDETKETTTK